MRRPPGVDTLLPQVHEHAPERAGERVQVVRGREAERATGDGAAVLELGLQVVDRCDTLTVTVPCLGRRRLQRGERARSRRLDSGDRGRNAGRAVDDLPQLGDEAMFRLRQSELIDDEHLLLAKGVDQFRQCPWC